MNASLPFMTSADDCLACAAGAFCPVGSINETPCAPGTHNAEPEQSTCVNCVPGTYQDLAGNTTCKLCESGHYCAEGSAAPLPCPGGRRMDPSLPFMTSADDCVVCAAGVFCPVGSIDETPCSHLRSHACEAPCGRS